MPVKDISYNHYDDKHEQFDFSFYGLVVIDSTLEGLTKVRLRTRLGSPCSVSAEVIIIVSIIIIHSRKLSSADCHIDRLASVSNYLLS